ncbi:hypothetical protein D3C85_1416650 [compost metagenome]
MRRRDNRRAGVWGQCHPGGNHHPILIHRHGDGSDMQMSEQFPSRRVPGVFQPDAISRLQQGLGNQRDAVAISGRDEYLGGGASDSTRNLQVRGDLGT